MNSTKEVKGNRKWRRMILTAAFLVLIALSANAQISGKSIPELRQAATASYQPSLLPIFHYSNFSTLQLVDFKSNLSNSKPTVPVIYSYDHLAFFCKIEVKLEKAVKLPIKFRLGDVDYVDRLEGKRQ